MPYEEKVLSNTGSARKDKNAEPDDGSHDGKVNFADGEAYKTESDKKAVGDEGVLYKLWLNIICGHNPKLIHKCLTQCGTAEEIFENDSAYNGMLRCLPMGQRLKVRRSFENARNLAEYCAERETDIITINDSRYPKRLKQVYMPPQILYVKGELPDIDSLVCITVVGSRHCTDSGREFANNLAYNLARQGVLIVGGMAEGIDSAAHVGALEAGHKTVAVLAGGPDIIYPKSAEDIYNEICANGAVISERPPGTIGRGYFYKERNRIMVGLSQGTVITEGEERSGTKLTAVWTTDSNRDLFAVPGKPDDRYSALPNSLIKDSAKLITAAEDIIDEYSSVYAEELEYGRSLTEKFEGAKKKRFADLGFNPVAVNARREKIKEKRRSKARAVGGANAQEDSEERLKPLKPDFLAFDEKQRIILEYLYNNNGAAHVDDISRDCGIYMSELSFLIIQLEMSGIVRQSAGCYYNLT